MFGLSKSFSAFMFSQGLGLPTRFLEEVRFPTPLAFGIDFPKSGGDPIYLEATPATFMISSSLLSRCFQGSGLRNQRPLPTAVEMDRLVERLVVWLFSVK